MCGRQRRRVKQQHGVPHSAYVDPFCSRTCCERWYARKPKRDRLGRFVKFTLVSSVGATLPAVSEA